MASPRSLRSLRFFGLLIASTLALSSGAAAQSATGSIVGTVEDPSGALLPGATVTLTHLSTGVSRSVVTEEAGRYEFPFLPIGDYEITAALDGFGPAVVPRVTLLLGQSLRVPLPLRMKDVAESVTVNATAPLITTERPGLSHIVTGTQIAELPLNERDVLSFVQQMPGGANRRASGIIIGGNRAYTTNYSIEGLNNTDEAFKAPISVPPVDAVQEMEVKATLMTAASGSASSTISLAIKAGTNAFRGSVYDYYRSNLWEARNFFNPTNEVPNRLRHQYGGTIGGPILRRRTFFFGSFSGVWLDANATRTGLLPTLAMRNGDFSSLRIPITNPFTGQVYADGIIPRSHFHPYAAKMLEVIPEPNVDNPSLNYYAALPETDDNKQYIGRIDHELTGSDRLSGYVNAVRGRRNSPGDGLPAIGHSIYERKSVAGIVRYTKTLGSSVVNEFSVGATSLHNDSLPGGGDVRWMDELGIRGVPIASEAEMYGFPDMRMTPYMIVRDIHQWPDRYSTYNFSYVNNLNWVLGRHTIQTGFDLRRNQMNHARRNNTRGGFTFLPQPTGHVFASVLLGSPRTVLASSPRDFIYLRKWDTGYYIQDTWKPTDRWTLSLGLRYELFTNPVEKYNRQSTFDAATGRIVVASEDGSLPTSAIPPEYFTTIQLPLVASTEVGLPRSLVPNDRNNFAPRLGVAYQPFGPGTVFRGGFGLYYFPQKQDRLLQGAANPPFTTTIRADGSAAAGWLDISNPFARGQNATAANLMYALSPTYKDPYHRNFDATVEHQLGSATSVRASYVGNRGRNLNQFIDLNLGIPVVQADGLVNAVRPFPALAAVLLSEPVGETDYDAMELEIKRRFSAGWGFQANYVLARAMSISDLDDWQPTENEIRRERGRSTYIPTHVFNFNAIYSLPFGQGQRFLASANGLTDALLGGWNLSVLGKMTSGQWFSPYVQHSLLAGRGNAISGRPDIVPGCDPNAGPRTVERWFNLDCFTPVPNGEARYGTAGRTIIEGPGFVNMDASIYKKVHFSANAALTFRIEVFNVMNHPNFTLRDQGSIGQVDITFPETSGNLVSTVNPARQFQFAVRLDF